MTEEQLVYYMVCYIREHSLKDLMKLVLRAINKAEEIKDKRKKWLKNGNN